MYEKVIIFVGKTNALGGFDIYHEINWVADEDFTEIIKAPPITINNSNAECIEKLNGLSLRSKILLSAVAGAAIQYLIDHDITFLGAWEIKVEQEIDYLIKENNNTLESINKMKQKLMNDINEINELLRKHES